MGADRAGAAIVSSRRDAVEIAAIEDRYRRRLGTLRKIGKWPLIGALIGVGALFVGRFVGPGVADEIGARAGAGFARGMATAQSEIAALRRQLSIGGWGTYR